MEILNLGSGSKGNSLYLGINGSNILIDVGLSKKQINKRLMIERGIDLELIDLIFITHSHSDHAKSIGIINRAYPHIKFVIPEKSYSEIIKLINGDLPNDNLILINDKGLNGKNIKVIAKKVNHDIFCYAYKFVDKDNNETYMHIPDNGGIPFKEYDNFKGCTYYAIESNYDTTMEIMHERRPALTKRRTLGFYGHNSNDEAFKLAQNVVGSNTKGIIFHHLSSECNSPQHAENIHDNLMEIWGEKRKFQNIKIVYATEEGGEWLTQNPMT